MPRLIINADDLGANPQRSHGIFQCAEFGVVTSASLLPNGSDSDAAARHARERGLPTGLHLNLTSEYPVSKQDDVSSLTEPNGRFMDHAHLLMAIGEGKVALDHLEREIRSQIEWFLDAHGAPTHLSSHDHIHIHPFVLQAILPALDRYGIRFVRIPCEEPLPPYGYNVSEEQLEEVRLLNAAATVASGLYVANGIAVTDHFRGSTLLGNASLKNLRHILGRLPEGTTELMVHPGSACAYGTPFDLDPQRQTELRMLLDETIPVLMKERKVVRCAFGD